MSLIQLRKPWARQPQGVVRLNREHPLARNVVGGWISPQAGTLLRGDRTEGLSGSGTTQRLKPHGQGTGFGSYAGSGIISLPNTAEQRLTALNASMVAGVTLGTLTTSQYQTIWSVRDASTSVALFLVGLDATNYSGGRLAASIAGVDMIGTSGSAKQNAYAAYGAQWGSGGRRMYVNGEVDSTNANTSQVSSTSIRPALGNRQSGGRALADGELHWWFAFDINIGDFWHASVARDPYQLVEPRRIWVPVSAGGGGGFQAAWARNRSQVIGAGVR